MKKIALTLSLILVVASLTAQIKRIATDPETIAKILPELSEMKTPVVKSYDFKRAVPLRTRLKNKAGQDSLTDKVLEVSQKVIVDLRSESVKAVQTSSGKAWLLKINMQNVSGIGLIFKSLKLSKDAEMYIFNENKSELDSAIKQDNFAYTDYVGVTPLGGSSITIVVLERGNKGAFSSSFVIEALQAGLPQNAAKRTTNSSLTVDCSPGVYCNPEKMYLARAVAVFTSNGYTGTGTLINNQNGDGTGYFITAFHVLDLNNNDILDASEVSALSGSSITFKKWINGCPAGSANSTISLFGATLVASRYQSDAVLLKMLNPPGAGDAVSYAGWNRSSSTPADVGPFIIHHPGGTYMAITHTDDVYDNIANPNFWRAAYSSGVVTGGSSGSALFDANGGIIGTLKGGDSSCDNTDGSDTYGKFSLSFSAFGSYLSPSNSTSLGVLDMTTQSIFGSATLPCIGATASYSVPNFANCTFTWTASAGITITSGQGTRMITISRVGSVNDPPSSTITVAITRNTGVVKTLTLSKVVPVDVLPNTPEVVYNGPSCSTFSSLTLSYGAKYNGHTACTLNSADNITEVEWQVYSSYSYSETDNTGYYHCSSVNRGGISITFPVQGSPYYVTMRCRVKNSCGVWSKWTPGFSNVIRNCSSMAVATENYMVYPNPANTELTIETSTSSETEVSASEVSNDRVLVAPQIDLLESIKYRLLNNKGEVVRQGTTTQNSKKTPIDVSNLPNGEYYIHLIEKDKIIKKHVIIKH